MATYFCHDRLFGYHPIYVLKMNKITSTLEAARVDTHLDVPAKWTELLALENDGVEEANPKDYTPPLKPQN